MVRRARAAAALAWLPLTAAALSQPTLFVLFESASGFALFEQVESEEIGSQLEEVQRSVTELARFSKIMKLKAFQVRLRGMWRALP